MAESTQIRDAIGGFKDYLRKFSKTELEVWPSVERLMYMWLSEGEAIKDCSGDHRIFLSAVGVVFAEWHDSRLKGEEQVIPSTIAQARIVPEEINHGDIFDPYVFIGCKDAVDRGIFD